MSKVVIDLSNYKDTRSARVPEGRYRVQVEDVEEAKARTGATMLVLYLRIMGGDQDGANLVERMTLSERALFRVVSFMQAIGLPTPKKRLAVDISKWRGKVVDVDVADGEPYNGQVNSEVKAFLKPAKVETAVAEDIEDIDTAEAEEPAATEAPETTGSDDTEVASEGTTGEIDLDDIDL